MDTPIAISITIPNQTVVALEIGPSEMVLWTTATATKHPKASIAVLSITILTQNVVTLAMG